MALFGSLLTARASRQIAAFSDPIRSANPNQFPSISSLKRGVIHVLSSRCRQSPFVLTPLSHSVPDPLLRHLLYRPHLHVADLRERERERGIESKAFIQFDKCNTFADGWENIDQQVMSVIVLWFDLSVWRSEQSWWLQSMIIQDQKIGFMYLNCI